MENNKNKHPFGAYMRELMAPKDISQRQLSQSTGIPESVISKMFRGERLRTTTSREKILFMAKYLYEQDAIKTSNQINKILDKAGEGGLTPEPFDKYCIQSGIEVQLYKMVYQNETREDSNLSISIESTNERYSTHVIQETIEELKDFLSFIEKLNKLKRHIIYFFALFITISLLFFLIIVKPSIISKKKHHHRGDVHSVATSFDSTLFASAGADGTIGIWDRDGEFQRSLVGHARGTRELAFCSTNHLLASGGDDTNISIWSVDSGEKIQTLIGHGRIVRGLSWSPNCDRLASGGNDNALFIWDTLSGNIIFQGEHDHWIRDVKWSPDGTYLASSSKDHKLIIWDTVNWEKVKILHNYTDTVLDWHPCQPIIATGNMLGEIVIWDISLDNPLKILSGHSQNITDIAWHPNGEILASASRESSIKLWDASNNYRLYKTILGHSDAVWNVSWFNDGTQLITGSADDNIGLWKFKKKTAIKDTCK